MRLCKEDLLLNIFISMEGIFDIFCPNEDMVGFLNLQGKQESLILKYNFLRVCVAGESCRVKISI